MKIYTKKRLREIENATENFYNNKIFININKHAASSKKK